MPRSKKKSASSTTRATQSTVATRRPPSPPTIVATTQAPDTAVKKINALYQAITKFGPRSHSLATSSREERLMTTWALTPPIAKKDQQGANYWLFNLQPSVEMHEEAKEEDAIAREIKRDPHCYVLCDDHLSIYEVEHSSKGEYHYTGTFSDKKTGKKYVLHVYFDENNEAKTNFSFYNKDTEEVGPGVEELMTQFLEFAQERVSPLMEQIKGITNHPKKVVNKKLKDFEKADEAYHLIKNSLDKARQRQEEEILLLQLKEILQDCATLKSYYEQQYYRKDEDFYKKLELAEETGLKRKKQLEESLEAPIVVSPPNDRKESKEETEIEAAVPSLENDDYKRSVSSSSHSPLDKLKKQLEQLHKRDVLGMGQGLVKFFTTRENESFLEPLQSLTRSLIEKYFSLSKHHIKTIDPLQNLIIMEQLIKIPGVSDINRSIIFYHYLLHLNMLLELNKERPDEEIRPILDKIVFFDLRVREFFNPIKDQVLINRFNTTVGNLHKLANVLNDLAAQIIQRADNPRAPIFINYYNSLKKNDPLLWINFLKVAIRDSKKEIINFLLQEKCEHPSIKKHIALEHAILHFKLEEVGIVLKHFLKNEIEVDVAFLFEYGTYTESEKELISNQLKKSKKKTPLLMPHEVNEMSLIVLLYLHPNPCLVEMVNRCLGKHSHEFHKLLGEYVCSPAVKKISNIKEIRHIVAHHFQAYAKQKDARNALFVQFNEELDALIQGTRPDKDILIVQLLQRLEVETNKEILEKEIWIDLLKTLMKKYSRKLITKEKIEQVLEVLQGLGESSSTKRAFIPAFIKAQVIITLSILKRQDVLEWLFSGTNIQDVDLDVDKTTTPIEFKEKLIILDEYLKYYQSHPLSADKRSAFFEVYREFRGKVNDLLDSTLEKHKAGAQLLFAKMDEFFAPEIAAIPVSPQIIAPREETKENREEPTEVLASINETASARFFSHTRSPCTTTTPVTELSAAPT